MKNKLAWYRFSLFKLLAIFTVSCMAIGWYCRLQYRANVQADAIKILTGIAEGQTSVVPTNSSAAPNAVAYYDYQQPTMVDELSLFFVASDRQPNFWAKKIGVDLVHDVESVIFQVKATQRLIGQLKRLPGLKKVQLTNGVADQASWAALTECTTIQQLNCISNMQIIRAPNTNSFELTNLRNLNHLTHFSVQRRIVSTQNLTDIANTKSIQHLALIDVNIQPETLDQFPLMENIESFTWKYFRYTEPGPLDDEHFKFIEKMPNVKTAKIICRVSRQYDETLSFEFESELSKRTLPLAGLTGTVFDSIVKLNKLENLTLAGTEFDGQGFEQLAQLLNLRVLRLETFQLEDEPFELLSNIRNLEHLELSSTRITDKGIQAIRDLPNLKHLSILSCKITDEGLKKIGYLPRLRFLRIKGRTITNAGRLAFQKLNPRCEIELEE